MHGAWFIHGMLEDERNWSALIECLGIGDARVERFPWSAQSGQYWGVGVDCKHWIDRIDQRDRAPPGMMVAHSYGCNVLLEYLLAQPDRQPEVLVLVSPFFRESKDDVTWATLQQLIDGLEGLIAESIQFSDRGHRYSGELLEDIITRIRDRLGVYGWVQFLQLFLNAPNLELHKLRSRTLVVSGDRDGYCPVDSLILLGQRISDSAVHIIPSGGHFAQLTHARQVADEICRFINNVCSQPREVINEL